MKAKGKLPYVIGFDCNFHAVNVLNFSNADSQAAMVSSTYVPSVSDATPQAYSMNNDNYKIVRSIQR